MNDTHKFREHRMEAARETGCPLAAQRGYDFRPEQADSPYAPYIILTAVVVILALGMIAVGVGNV